MVALGWLEKDWKNYKVAAGVVEDNEQLEQVQKK